MSKRRVAANHSFGPFVWNDTQMAFSGTLQSSLLDLRIAPHGVIPILVEDLYFGQTECELDDFQHGSLDVFLKSQKSILDAMEKQLAQDCSNAPKERGAVPYDIWRRVKGCTLRFPHFRAKTTAEIKSLCDAMHLKGMRRKAMEKSLRAEADVVSLSKLIVDVDWDESHLTVCQIVNGTFDSVGKE